MYIHLVTIIDIRILQLFVESQIRGIGDTMDLRVSACERPRMSNNKRYIASRTNVTQHIKCNTQKCDTQHATCIYETTMKLDIFDICVPEERKRENRATDGVTVSLRSWNATFIRSSYHPVFGYTFV